MALLETLKRFLKNNYKKFTVLDWTILFIVVILPIGSIPLGIGWFGARFHQFHKENKRKEQDEISSRDSADSFLPPHR